MGEFKNSTKIVVGYDLGKITSQISYFNLSEEEPETVSTIAGMEQYSIPTVLCKRKGVNQWYYGKEAEKVAKEEQGSLVKNILSLARMGQTIEVEEKEYKSEELLALFVKRSLGLLSLVCPTNKVEAIVITVDEVDTKMLDILEKVSKGLPLRAKEIFYQSKEESFFSYVIHQEPTLWTKQVALCDMTEGYLRIFRLEMNRKTKPIVSYIEKTEFEELNILAMPLNEVARENFKEMFDSLMQKAVKSIFEEHIISSVYLIGDAFLGEWCKETLRYACQGRRVFQGSNLYSKGACYLGKEKLEKTETNKSLIFLGNDKLKANVGMKLVSVGQDIYFPLLDAGQNWYEVQKDIEIVLESGNGIEIIVTPLNGKNVKNVNFIMEGLPERPPKASRIKFIVDMTSESILRMRAEDMGFGEIFPSTQKEWIEEFEIV